MSRSATCTTASGPWAPLSFSLLLPTTRVRFGMVVLLHWMLGGLCVRVGTARFVLFPSTNPSMSIVMLMLGWGVM